MARVFHHLALLLLVSLLLLAADLTASAAVDAPGGKKVTITMRYAPADPAGKKKKKNLHISVRYTDEDAGRDTKYFSLDGHDDEPIGIAVQYLLASLEKLHGDAGSKRAPRAEL